MEHDTRDIPLEQIDEPAAAMRTEIPRDEIFELAADIKKNGLINPITVRPLNDRYEVVAGHRRFLAHRYGGLVTIRCVVRELSDDESFAIMTSENLKREDVNPVDEASHVDRLLSIHGGDVSKVSDIVNRSEEWVRQRVTIAAMPDNLKVALRQGKIKIGVALALTKITNETDLAACLEMAIVQGASITMVNYWVAQWDAGLFGSALLARINDPDAPTGQRQVVMLRCAVDGKEYPAADFTSVLVRRDNLIFIEGLREHLMQESPGATPSPVASEVVAGTE